MDPSRMSLSSSPCKCHGKPTFYASLFGARSTCPVQPNTRTRARLRQRVRSWFPATNPWSHVLRVMKPLHQLTMEQNKCKLSNTVFLLGFPSNMSLTGTCCWWLGSCWGWRRGVLTLCAGVVLTFCLVFEIAIEMGWIVLKAGKRSGIDKRP